MPRFKYLALAGCMATALVVGSAARAAGGNDGNFGFGQGAVSGFHPGPGNYQQGAWHRRGAELRLLGRVGLTDSQKASIVGLLKSNRAKMQTVRQEEMAARKALMGIKPDDASYNSTLDSSANKLADAARQKFELQGQLRASIYNVLTPDQKTKLAALKTEMQFDRIFGRGGQGAGNWHRQGGVSGTGSSSGNAGGTGGGTT